MSIKNLILVFNSVTVSYFICYNSLLQNATDVITKCDSYFITKYDRSLLQNTLGFLLQNATVITNCDDLITNCDSYYKMRRLLQIVTVQLLLKASKARNKYLIPLLYLLINCILAKSTSQTLPLNE